MAEAPAVTRVVAERGQHFSEVSVFLNNGEETRLRGPARRNRQEALKDCLELRKVAVKSTGDPSLFLVRQRKKELEDSVWTVKDLGGRQLDGAEGPPPGYVAPRTASVASAAPEPARPAAQGRPAAAGGRYRGVVKGNSTSQDCVVEVADVALAVPGQGEAWASRAKVALQQAFKRFGPVMEVHLDVESSEGTERIASVRFASAKAAELAMTKAQQGFLPVGSGQVRLRQATAAEAVWRRFPPARRAGPALEPEAPRKRLRPNERFAARLPAAAEELDESERFWEAQHDRRGKPAEPPRPQPAPEPAPPPEPAPAPAPEKPAPAVPEPGASEEDLEVCKGEAQVAEDMAGILEKPFSQQKKALKALRLRWHPDKNPECGEVATRVFQFIQAHDAWLAHHDLA